MSDEKNMYEICNSLGELMGLMQSYLLSENTEIPDDLLKMLQRLRVYDPYIRMMVVYNNIVNLHCIFGVPLVSNRERILKITKIICDEDDKRLSVLFSQLVIYCIGSRTLLKNLVGTEYMPNDYDIYDAVTYLKQNHHVKQEVSEIKKSWLDIIQDTENQKVEDIICTFDPDTQKCLCVSPENFSDEDPCNPDTQKCRHTSSKNLSDED
jgi:hypothetical protein